jgi:predicted amidohydrolase
MVKTAIVQMKSSIDKDENLKFSLDQIEEAKIKKAKIVCFPEFQMAFSPIDQSAKDLYSLSEYLNSGFISQLSKSAKRNGIFIVCSIYEKPLMPIDKPKFSSDNKINYANQYRVFDTVALINNKGQLISFYRKLHLYDALGFKESKKLMAGDKVFSPVQSPLGNLGALICYDLRFPELSRALTLKGSQVLMAPSAWVQGTMKEDHWITMCKARAIENGIYVIAPNQVGNIFCGRSLIVDPFGIVLLDMGNKEGMEIIDIDLSRIQIVRNDLPLLMNRRKDVYDDQT